jgi:hypothetical protein
VSATGANSNPAALEGLQGLALEYARWHGWRDKVLGIVHPSRRRRLAAKARQGLAYAGRMVYTEGPTRSMFFNAPPNIYAGEHADCSQYGAGCGHRVGVKTLTEIDWTGTIWDKGTVIAAPRIGAFVIFGPKPGVHLGIVTGRRNGQWLVTGFGSQHAPDVNTLAELASYFTQTGHGGTRYIDITR